MNKLTLHNAVVDVTESNVPITATSDIVAARQNGRRLAEQYKFTKSQQTRFATAISELARNVLTYAVKGDCLFSVPNSPNKIIITAAVIDNGPGIEDIGLALKDGYSGGYGLGLGLSGARRLVDAFSIESTPGLTKVEVSIIRQNVLNRDRS